MSFKSWRSYYVFSQEVKRGSRYIHSDEVKDFLLNVLETSKDRVTIVNPDNFWRAQLGSEWLYVLDSDEIVVDEPAPFSEERMKPIQYEASEGRANPKGIPCLYLATDEKTAMSEVRPWLGSDISVGQFKTVRELKLIDCSVHASKRRGYRIYFEEPDDQKKVAAVWADIDRAFAQPVTPNDKSSDYVPTQIIAELFKTNGFDGIFYKSALSEGLNVALFDINAATMVNCFVCRVEEIKFSFAQSGNSYFIKSKSDENK